MPQTSFLEKITNILSNKKEDNPLFFNQIGLYSTKLNIQGKEHKITSEVELIREFNSGPIREIQVRHNKIYELNNDLKDDALRMLEEEHMLMTIDDVQWN